LLKHNVISSQVHPFEYDPTDQVLLEIEPGCS